MTAARLVRYRQLARVADRAGYRWQRSEGNHNIFQNDAGEIIVIPDHGSRVIGVVC